MSTFFFLVPCFPEVAPRQPLVATRCLRQMLSSAVSRATTDDRYAGAVGLALPSSRYEDPPLQAVVGAATRATEHVCRLLARRSSAWPIPEFATAAAAAPRGVGGHQRGAKVVYVPGAARSAGGEVVGSPLHTPTDSAVEADSDAALDRLRGAVVASGGLPVDWAATLPSFGLPNLGDPGVAAQQADAVLRAAALPAVPPKIAEAFGPGALAGREGSRAPLGPREAWSRVEELEAYLGSGLISEDLRFRLAEALAGGGVMRGPPPPWRTLVRDAIERRVVSAAGGDAARRPLVVHFIAARGQERLGGGGSDLVAPGLLEAEDFRAVSFGGSFLWSV